MHYINKTILKNIQSTFTVTFISHQTDEIIQLASYCSWIQFCIIRQTSNMFNM